MSIKMEKEDLSLVIFIFLFVVRFGLFIYVYDTKKAAGESPVMLELWVMLSTSLLPLLPDLLWPSMVELDRVLSLSQIYLTI